MTHIIVPENKNNTWDENIENLIGIANGMFIVKASCEYQLVCKLIFIFMMFLNFIRILMFFVCN